MLMVYMKVSTLTSKHVLQLTLRMHTTELLDFLLTQLLELYPFLPPKLDLCSSPNQ